MDWASYTEELKSQTRNIANSRSLLQGSSSLGYDRGNTSEYLYDDANDEDHDPVRRYNMGSQQSAGNSADLNRSITDMKLQHAKYERKLNSLESLIRDYNQLLDSSTESQISVTSRVDQLEHEFYSNMQSNSSLAKERSDMIIQYKSMFSRLSAMENLVNDIDGQFATKDAFSRLLDTTMDQLKSIRIQSESSKSKSSQALSLVEGFALALFELSGGNSGTALRLDFLSTIAGERQSEQIGHLLTDSLRGAIASECTYQVNQAAEELTNSIRPITEGLRNQLLASSHEFQSSISSIKSTTTELDELKKMMKSLNATQAAQANAISQLQYSQKDLTVESIRSLIASSAEAQTHQLVLLRRQQETLEDELRTVKKKLIQISSTDEVEELRRGTELKLHNVDTLCRDISGRLSDLESSNRVKDKFELQLETKLEEKIAGIKHDVSHLSALSGELEKSLFASKGAVDGKLEKIHEFSMKLTHQEELLGNALGRIESCEMRVTNSHETIVEEQQSIRALVSTASKTASALQLNAQTHMVSSITSINDTVAATSKQCTDLRTEMDKKMVELLSEVVIMVDGVKKSVSDSGFAPRLSAIEHKVAENERKFHPSVVGLSDTNAGVTKKDDIEDIQQELTLLHNAQAQLSDTQDELSNSIDKIQSQIVSLGRSATEREAVVEAIRKEVMDLSGSISKGAVSSGVPSSSYSKDISSDNMTVSENRIILVENSVKSMKQAMDALQEELISMSVKMESIGTCDDEGCGVALNCDTRIDALGATVASLQSMVNNMIKSGMKSTDSPNIIPPPPPPVQPTLFSSHSQSKVNGSPRVTGLSGARPDGQAKTDPSNTPSDVLTSILNANQSAKAGGLDLITPKDRALALRQIREQDPDDKTTTQANQSDYVDGIKVEDNADNNEDCKSEDNSSTNLSDSEEVLGQKRTKKQQQDGEDDDDDDDVDDDVDIRENDNAGPEEDSSFDDEESVSSTEEKIYGKKGVTVEQKLDSDAPNQDEFRKRLEAEHARAKVNAAARNMSPATSTSNTVSSSHQDTPIAAPGKQIGTPIPDVSNVPESETRSIFSGSLQRRKVNAFPDIEAGSNSPLPFNSMPNAINPQRTISLMGHAATTSSGGAGTKDVMGLAKLNDKPLFQTLAASYVNPTPSASTTTPVANNSITQPETNGSHSRNLRIEIPPDTGIDLGTAVNNNQEDEANNAMVMNKTGDKGGAALGASEEESEDEEHDKESDESNDDEDDDDDDDDDDDSSSGDEDDDKEGNKEDSDSDESSTTNNQNNELESRPPINDPAAVTKAAALRALNASNNVPIGTKISAGGVTSLPGSSVFANSPRGLTPPGPSLSSLTNMSGRTLTPTPGSASPYPHATSAAAASSIMATSPHATATPKGIQCPHCLKKFPQVELPIHTNSCDLRPEYCKYGCGTKVMFMKMHQHVDICPARVKENARIAAEIRNEAAEAKAEAKSNKGNPGLGSKISQSLHDSYHDSSDDSEDYDIKKPKEAEIKRPPPSQALAPAAKGSINSGRSGKVEFDDADSSFESSASSDLDALWGMAATENSEGIKPLQLPAGSSLLSSGKTIPAGLPPKSLKPIEDIDENDDAGSSSLLSSKRSNRLTAKINRSGTLAAGMMNDANKVSGV